MIEDVAIKMLPIESPESLSSWLTKELSPICDADPGALAKYVLALLKKPLSSEEIKDVCMQQLEVFLQTHTRRFVEKLFTALTEKSYMDPVDPPAPVVSTTSTVVPVEEKKEKKEEKKEKEKKKEVTKEKSEERKEKSKEKEPSPVHSASASQSSSSVSGERSRRAAASSSMSSLGKREGGSTSDSAAPSSSSTRRSPVRAPRKRVSPPPQLNRRRSRSPPARGNRRVGGVRRSPIREKRRSRSRSPIEKDRRRERTDRDEEPSKRKRKERCKDFDEQGVCLRGDACPYDHGLDPVVVENAALAAMGLKTVAAAATSTTYSVPPPGYNPLPSNPPPPGVEGVGYNPEAPGLAIGDFSVPPPPIPVQGGWRQANPYAMPPQVGYEPSGSIPVDPHSGGMMGGMGGVMRGRGRGRGRGAYHPYARGGHAGVGGGGETNKEETLAAPVAARTLIVKKIPAELNNISKLNEHFEQFGSITNMQVHYERQPDTALITFSSRFEAIKAYKNPEPIFNNRFIRVFWYANVTGEGGPNKTTLSSGVTVECPEPIHTPVVRPEPVVLPGPGQTKYRKPEAVEAFKKKQEEAATRKADKESHLRQKDLLRRTVRVLSDLQEQQKQVIMAMMKETDADKKKTLNKMYKTLDGKIASQKGDVETETEKLKTIEGRIAKHDPDRGAEGGSSSGDEALLSPEEGTEGSGVKIEEDNEDDLLSAQVDEDFAALKQEQATQ